MPELPEVETVAQGLAGTLTGKAFTGVSVRWPKTVAYPTVAQFAEQIVGRQVMSVGRRGKYIVINLDQGALLIHLKMSGQLQVISSRTPQDKHDHTVFDLDNGQQLRFRDVRKFGRVYLVGDPTKVTGMLGPEPLAVDFRTGDFQKLLARRSGRLKSLLLNQQFLAGLGNIYADESLFAARLHPLRKADSLTADEQHRLYKAIRAVLGQAVEDQGTTLDDGGYLNARGEAGTHQEKIAVYGRTGKACPVCDSAIERLIVGGRSTHYCPSCQP